MREINIWILFHFSSFFHISLVQFICKGQRERRLPPNINSRLNDIEKEGKKREKVRGKVRWRYWVTDLFRACELHFGQYKIKRVALLYILYCASATTGQTRTGASLRVEDGTRSARVERGGRGTDQCCNVRAKMEEPSIHGSIGDINSAETTKSKCESVNIKLFSISSFERRMTSLRNLSHGR